MSVMTAPKFSSCPVLGLFTLPDIVNMFQSLDLPLYLKITPIPLKILKQFRFSK